MSFFLKLLGISGTEPLPEVWWEKRPEIADAVFFSEEPKAIQPSSTLIYYAVGGEGRLCGVARVIGRATEKFETPPGWSAERRARFGVRMPVSILARCRANTTAPKFRDFHDKQVVAGSYQALPDDEARRMIAAIALLDANVSSNAASILSPIVILRSDAWTWESAIVNIAKSVLGAALDDGKKITFHIRGYPYSAVGTSSDAWNRAIMAAATRVRDSENPHPNDYHQSNYEGRDAVESLSRRVMRILLNEMIRMDI